MKDCDCGRKEMIKEKDCFEEVKINRVVEGRKIVEKFNFSVSMYYCPRCKSRFIIRDQVLSIKGR